MKFTKLVHQLRSQLKIRQIKYGANANVYQLHLGVTGQQHLGSVNLLKKHSHFYLVNGNDCAEIFCPSTIAESADYSKFDDYQCHIVNIINQLFQQEQQENTHILEALTSSFRESSIEQVLNQLAQKLNNSLLIMSSNYQIIAYSTQFGLPPAPWCNVIKQGYSDDKIIMQISRSISLPLLAAHQPYKTSITKGEELVINLFNQGNLIAFLVLFNDQHPIDDDQRALLTTAAIFLKQRLLAAGLINNWNSQWEDSLIELLKNDRFDSIPAILNKHHLTFPAEQALLFCQSTGDRPLSFLKMALQHLLVKEFGSALTSVYEGRVVSNFKLPIRELHCSVTEKKLTKIAKQLKITMLVTNPFNDLRQIHDMYQLGLTGCHLLTINQPVEFLYRHQLLLLSTISQDKYHLLIDPEIEQLKQYDIQHRTALLPTLATLIKYNGQIQKAAAALYVHRNTLTNRIKQIERISGYNLANYADLFAINFSLQLSNIIKNNPING